MYISKIYIKNIRCFEEITINFENNGNYSPWTMITGDNAVGKTCLLRCLALGLCDEANATALIKELKGPFLRENNSSNVLEGNIEITLKTNSLNREFKITTNISKKTPRSPEQVRQRTEPIDSFPWEDVFVCGYGPHRALPADTSHENYIALEAVFTLFNNEAHMQNPELILNRQDPVTRKHLTRKLLNVLMLDEQENDISFTKKGMEIPGHWGTLPVDVLSDGYRSTLNWVTDFFGWSIFADRFGKPDDDFMGILLIDELEQHLHPIWQRYIVKRLHEQFPRVQFISTTHSPLVAVGVSDIDHATLFRLIVDKNRKVKKEDIVTAHLKGMRADQVLTSEAFGLPTARSGDINEKLMRFEELYLQKSLTRTESEEFEDLKQLLSKDIPEYGENKEDRKTEYELLLQLKEISKLLSEKSHD